MERVSQRIQAWAELPSSTPEVERELPRVAAQLLGLLTESVGRDGLEALPLADAESRKKKSNAKKKQE